MARARDGRGAVARDVQQVVHLALVQMTGDPPLDAGREERTGGVAAQNALTAQIAEEGPQAASFRADEVFLRPRVQACQEGADEQVVHVGGTRLATQLLADVGQQIAPGLRRRP